MAGVAVAFRDRGGSKAVLRVGANRLDAVALGDEALQRPDGDGCVDGASAAGVLAGRRAHAAADRGERIGSPGDEVGLLVAVVGDQLHVPPGVRRDRTAAPGTSPGLSSPSMPGSRTRIGMIALENATKSAPLRAVHETRPSAYADTSRAPMTTVISGAVVETVLGVRSPGPDATRTHTTIEGRRMRGI